MTGLLTRNRLLGFGVAGVVCALDQYVKWLVRVPLELRAIGSIELLPFFDLRWAQNFGVSLGMFEATSPEMRWGLVLVTGIIAGIVAIWLLREKLFGDILPLGLVLGGALGNIYDRAVWGYVIDYADFHIGTFRPFLIFNLADAAISVGVVIILARALLIGDTSAKTSADRPAAERA